MRLTGTMVIEVMKLLLPRDYIREATELINKATRKVAFISMVLTDDESTDELVEALAAAAKRGVEVQVAGDMFTYTELSGQFIPSHYYSRRVRSTTRMARTLANAGVEFRWLGRLNITTVSGRTHSKWCVIDDVVFSFGGVNLYEQALENVDYMFRVKNAELAHKLAVEQRRIVLADKARYAYRSHTFVMNSKSTVLFDAGFFGDSIIYKRACQLATDAMHITLVSQYCPTGKLNRLLRQTDTTLYFNHWQKAKGFNRFVIRMGMFLTKLTTSYTRDNYLHAKCIIFTFPDGSKAAITGSHNFVNGGALLGTREVALETRDKKVIAELEEFVQTQVA